MPELKREGEIAAYNAGVRAMAAAVRAAADKMAVTKPSCRLARAVNALDEIADAAPALMLIDREKTNVGLGGNSKSNIVKATW